MLGGSKLNVVWAVVASLNVAVTVTVLADDRAAAPPITPVWYVPMKMASGLNVRPWVAEMTAGLVAGELGATAKLRGASC